MSTVATAISSVLLTFSRKKSILMYTRKAESSALLSRRLSFRTTLQDTPTMHGAR